MLRRMKQILSQLIKGVDGEVGEIKDVYFDDRSWEIRYFVVRTKGWLSGRDVLLVPEAVNMGSYYGDIKTSLNRKKVEDAPSIDSHLPVARQHEENLHAYYGWSPYWMTPPLSAPGLYYYPSITPSRLVARPAEGYEPTTERFSDQEGLIHGDRNHDPHLRSVKEVTGYHIAARDGTLGHVEDFLFESEEGRLTHLIVDTKNWLPGRKVVIDLGVPMAIDFAAAEVRVEMTREQIENAPEFDDSKLYDDGFLTELSLYYRDLDLERKAG